jgi:hypothetical protein
MASHSQLSNSIPVFDGTNFLPWSTKIQDYAMVAKTWIAVTGTAPTLKADGSNQDAVNRWEDNDTACKGLMQIKMTDLVKYKYLKDKMSGTGSSATTSPWTAKEIWDDFKALYGTPGITALSTEYAKLDAVRIRSGVDPRADLERIQYHTNQMGVYGFTLGPFFLSLLIVTKLPAEYKATVNPYLHGKTKHTDVKLEDIVNIVHNTWESTFQRCAPKPAESAKKITAIKHNEGCPSFKSQSNTAGSSAKKNFKPNDKVDAKKKDSKPQCTARGKGKGKGKERAHQANKEFASFAVKEDVPMVCHHISSLQIALTEADLQTDITTGGTSGSLHHAKGGLVSSKAQVSELAQALGLDPEHVKLPPSFYKAAEDAARLQYLQAQAQDKRPVKPAALVRLPAGVLIQDNAMDIKHAFTNPLAQGGRGSFETLSGPEDLWVHPIQDGPGSIEQTQDRRKLKLIHISVMDKVHDGLDYNSSDDYEEVKPGRKQRKAFKGFSAGPMFDDEPKVRPSKHPSPGPSPTGKQAKLAPSTSGHRVLAFGSIPVGGVDRLRQGGFLGEELVGNSMVGWETSSPADCGQLGASTKGLGEVLEEYPPLADSQEGDVHLTDWYASSYSEDIDHSHGDADLQSSRMVHPWS